MDNVYVAAIAIVVIAIIVVVFLTRGRLESMDVILGKLGFKVKTRPDPSPPAPSSIQIRDTSLADKSTITAPTSASLTSERNDLAGGSSINIYTPGEPGHQDPRDRDA